MSLIIERRIDDPKIEIYFAIKFSLSDLSWQQEFAWELILNFKSFKSFNFLIQKYWSFRVCGKLNGETGWCSRPSSEFEFKCFIGLPEKG